MAHALKLTTAVVEAQATALAALLDHGWLRIYDGAQPATADTAITTQVLLAELRLATPAEVSVTNGIITFDVITSDASANASGTATWFRMFKTDGTTKLYDGTVGVTGADVNLPTVTIVITDPVPSVGTLSLTHTVPKIA